jgi:hypothetical protein
MYRIGRQLRIRDVPLDALHSQPAHENAASAVLDSVSGPFLRDGLADEAIFDFVTVYQILACDAPDAVRALSFFIAGQ